MFKSIHIDGKSIKRVVSNGQTIWRKAENILTTTIRFDIRGSGSIFDLSDPVLMNYSPSEIERIKFVGRGSIPGSAIDDINTTGNTVKLNNKLSSYGISELRSGDQVKIVLKPGVRSDRVGGVVTTIREPTLPYGVVIYLKEPVNVSKEQIKSISVNGASIDGSEIEEIRNLGKDIKFKQQIGTLGLQQANIGDEIIIYLQQ